MSSLLIKSLRCEYRKNPLGIDVAQPRLSWEIESPRRGVFQKAYRIQVALSDSAFVTQADLLWDSGQIESSASVQVQYAGTKLNSAQRAYWKVTVWDDADNQAESELAWWEMGLLTESDWQAQWIGSAFIGGPRTTSPSPYLRREFDLPNKTIISARLYVTALGVYEYYINGSRVGEDIFTPGWTDYSKRIQYQTYDVTALIKSGVNALGAILGDGWAVGNVAWEGRQLYSDRPKLLAQIVAAYEDGSIETLQTDSNWKVSMGPILESDMLMGESYDARREFPGWNLIGFDEKQWLPVEVFSNTNIPLVATNGPAIRRHEELKPVSIKDKREFTQSRWIFDMGQNMVGRVRLKVSGSAGTTITLKYAEILNPDGTLYTANLRTARSVDYYTLRGDEIEVWESRFTFHGFRYVELRGYSGSVDIETITGIVIHSDTPTTGSFECSDPQINQLQQNIVWGQKGNFVDVPSDCPQRDERLGWTGDAQVFIRTAAFNMDVAGFFNKWSQDLEDAQYPNGAYPAVAPNPVWHIGDGGPGWADAGVICPWTTYLCYGDKQILASRYVSMQKFIDFLSQTSRNGLRCYAEYEGWHGFGDWLALDGSDGREGGTSKELIGTAFYAHSTRLLAQIASILGHEEDSRRYNAQSDEVRNAFCNRYLLPDNTLTGGTQTGYILALHFNLLPIHARQIAMDELVKNIQGRDTHLSTGFLGTPYINWVLSENGRIDVAYALLRQTTWPSWLYSVTQGATTIWERWDGWTQDKGFQDVSMNSFNHYAYGAIGAWMYAVIGGIDLDPAEPGYRHIMMQPKPGGGLTSAKAELHSPYGLISSHWKFDNHVFEWKINIPANSYATVTIPARSSARIYEQGKPVDEGSGIGLVRREAGQAVYKITSGEYHFTVE